MPETTQSDLVERPRRVQLRRTKGWRMPENTVKVDRTHQTFGNIFTVGCNPRHFSAALPDTCETVEQAVECFRYYANTWMALTQGRWIEPLRGKNLACWCRPGAPCHADILLELANAS
ncbi:DUF4326 domain-containing protein [Novosphingobium sp.]|uniref:DUF4326 domain-containing protein n=1 Tax=Novosphingobium sp. TaxID=1874826 RepID=UPI0028AE4493|nr:DUF4326 domain-containing protein [Novosphingobium sp.]